jgi:aldose 1-epimerase
VGRYANRIKNSTFELNSQSYEIPANDHNDTNTLHGGTEGYDVRNWTVVATNDSSITFSFLDEGLEGFPGTVFTLVTYTLSSFASGPTGQVRPRLTTTIVSSALDEPTPIMLSTHIYWNLNAFKAETLLNDTTLWMPYAARWIETDGNLIPNGKIGAVSTNPALDFTSPKLLGDSIAVAEGTCGTGCTGVDNAFILDRPVGSGESTVVPALSMWSDTTGIKMDMETNQQGVQIYTCNGQNGSIRVRRSVAEYVDNAAQNIEQYGCIVIEPQAWIDGINHPEWGVDKYEIFSAETQPLVFYATYDFSTF